MLHTAVTGCEEFMRSRFFHDDEHHCPDFLTPQYFAGHTSFFVNISLKMSQLYYMLKLNVSTSKLLLLGGFKPSENYESQLGLLFPIPMDPKTVWEGTWPPKSCPKYFLRRHLDPHGIYIYTYIYIYMEKYNSCSKPPTRLCWHTFLGEWSSTTSSEPRSDRPSSRSMAWISACRPVRWNKTYLASWGTPIVR